MREYRYIGGRWRKRRNKNIIVRVFPLANDPGNDTFWRTLCLGSIPLRSVAECKGDFPTWRERAMDAVDEGISLGWDLAHIDAIAGRASGEPAEPQGSESSGSDSDRESEEERYQDEYMRIFAPGILSYVSEPTQAQLMSFAEERRRVAEEGFVDYPKAESFVESVREFRPEVGFDGIDPGDLNTKQRAAYDHIVNLLSNAGPSDSKACFLHGVGGTGKTALISTVVKVCLEKYGEGSFMVLAPTGKAASLLPFGVTLHAGLKLPVPLTESTFEPLEGEALAALQDSARDLRLVIIDEISMVGCRFIAAIDSRLKQMRPDHRASLFGGVVTVLSGDMGQLPPVLDKPLYSKEAPGESFMCTQGRLVCSSVTKAIFLDQIMRTDQLDFQAMLQRIRDGDQTDEDHSVFLERELHRLPAIERADFEDSILLSSTRDRAAEINKTQLDNLPGYLVDCRAIHVGRGAAGASEEQARGLSSRLQLKIGVPVMLTANLAVACGLTNGSMGHVFGFMTAENDDNSSTLPVVLVQFPSYRGPSFNNLKPQVVPISPVSRVWQSGPHTCSRTQLPLTLAFASTIYKAQGSSLSRYLIDIGSKEIGLGSTYVALSRAKSLQSFAVHVTDRRNLSLARWKKIGRGKGAIERKSFEDHLRSLEFSE
ncbi:hypothetical protein FOZ60_009905 [Perkinsus olseni]|uniref:ATP-dependent DNA helicase n=3 Tax=Perkinsus olseni TaxID=32597 RepID=A0A7J6PMG9_PEROL|nr:hypothetical protein FOZ60_009905 [Perkinsus olseni]